MFTFLPLPEIGELEEQVRVAPERRAAQKRLAQEVTRLVHGERGLRVAERASAVLFGEAMDGLRADELLEIFANVPSAQMPLDRVQGAAVSELAAAAGLCRSKGEARRLIESGGLYLNNRRVQGVEARVGTADLVEGRLLVLRSGKKAFHLVKVA
jgi:tyrosyl-tRNA synthetase